MNTHIDHWTYRVLDKLNAPSAHRSEFHLSHIRNIRLVKSWPVLDNPHPMQSTENDTVSRMNQYNSSSSWDMLCQDSEVQTALCQPPNAMARLYVRHLPGDIVSAQYDSRCDFLVYGGYLFECYKSWDTVARYADRHTIWLSGSYRMHTWLVKLSL